MSGHPFWERLDLDAGCLRSISPDSDSPKGVYVTRYDPYEFARIGFRLCNAPANLVLRVLTWNIVLAFLDDALVLGKGFEDHLDNLRSVFVKF